MTEGLETPGEDVQAPGLGRAAGAAAGRPHRARAADRQRPGARGRTGLRSLPVQPRDPGPPAAGQPLQAVRVSRRVRAPRRRSAGDAGDHPRGFPDRRRVGDQDRRGAVDAPQLRQRLSRADDGPAGAGALDQRPDGPRLAEGRPALRPRRRAGRRDDLPAARVPLDRPGRLRGLADGDRRGLRRAREQRRARGAERHRRRDDRGRNRARPQGDLARARASGGRGLPRRTRSCRARPTAGRAPARAPAA